MKNLPETEHTRLVRTDFSDEPAWQALRAAIGTPNRDGSLAYLHVVDDPAYSGSTPEQLISASPDTEMLIVADRTTLTTPGMPLLAVHPFDEDDEDDEEEFDEDDDGPKPGHGELRVIPEALPSLENNISIGNMDWESFVNGAEDDGVFRGFARRFRP
ncbi:hypothetical protein [Streptomyces sp. RFCAC02]|uniref:DUF6924 domain-containing protein n=1 Tax=Streptomyces sp. RFCAC02 TaxID=2499143 RepID=UPI001020CEE9|nr:hypothetical protein [Streptomyces sp. RFCAC02]